MEVIMKNKDIAIASTFGILFDLTARSFSTHLTNEFSKKGINLTAEQFKVLVILYNKNGLSQQKIADQIAKDKTSVTRLIHGLEKRNFVSRKRSKADLRHRFIYLTDEGKAIQKKVDKIYLKTIEEVFSAYDRKQIKEFRNFLKHAILAMNPKALI